MLSGLLSGVFFHELIDDETRSNGFENLDVVSVSNFAFECSQSGRNRWVCHDIFS
jgi:hypothetical protein